VSDDPSSSSSSGFVDVETIQLTDKLGFFFWEFGGYPWGSMILCHNDTNDNMCISCLVLDLPGFRELLGPEQLLYTVVWDDNGITLSPSVRCKACGLHGYFRNGMWEQLPREVLNDEGVWVPLFMPSPLQ
jgi:hypothetical protein